MAAAGAEPVRLPGGFEYEAGDAAAELLAAGELPDAVLAVNDEVAIGLLTGLRRAGVDVPGRVSVAGIDDTRPARLVDLTSVWLPLHELGERAARVILEGADGNVVLPHRLVPRATTAVRDEGQLARRRAGRRAGRLGRGEGQPVLVLHGGPGLSYEYLDELAADIGDGYCVAAFQQRGLAPSLSTGRSTSRVRSPTWSPCSTRSAGTARGCSGTRGAGICCCTSRSRLRGGCAAALRSIRSAGSATAARPSSRRSWPRGRRRRRRRAVELDQRAMRGEGTEEEIRREPAARVAGVLRLARHTMPLPAIAPRSRPTPVCGTR